MSWYGLLIDSELVLVAKFDHEPAPSEFPGFPWDILEDAEVAVIGVEIVVPGPVW